MLLVACIGCLLSCSNAENKDQQIFGKYKAYSDDPAINKFIAAEDNYIELRNDQTIIYNTTINAKPKFRFTGTYRFDEKANTLTISWKEGKLPGQLTIQKENQDYLIKVGETNYVKMKG